MQASGFELVIPLYEFVILLFSLSFHESAHAWMASRLGDQTSRLEGRISLNPIRHIDPFGTLLYPALMIFGPLIGFGGSGIVFGWGKPVPIITRNFTKITRDDNLVAIAGPAANLILVSISMVAMIFLGRFLPGGYDAVAAAVGGQILLGGSAVEPIALLCWLMIKVNFALVFFNLIPIPPLDASRFVRNLLPYNSLNTYDNFARYGFIVIFILGRFVVNLFLGPALNMVVHVLALFLASPK